MKFLSLLPPLLLAVATAPASAQLYVADGGSLTLSRPGSYLYANGLMVGAGGTLTVRGTLEWTGQATSQGTLVFRIAGSPGEDDFGRMIAPEGDDIVFEDDDVVRTELVGGFGPAGTLSYPLIEAGALDGLPAGQELPGPLWDYRFTDATVFAEFDEAGLPVEWLGFTGQWIGKTVRLAWETAAEVDADRYVVERRNPAGDWLDIGTVAAAGTSATPSRYHFNDVDPGPTDPVLYRLRQVDYSGDFTYSEVVALARAAGVTDVRLFPNPARDHLFVAGLPGGSFTITDVTGRAIARGRVSDAPRFRIELPTGLAAGNYWLRPAGGGAYRFAVVR